MKDINWESTVKAHFYDGGNEITIEDLYQAFKERFVKEHRIEVGSSGIYTILADKDELG